MAETPPPEPLPVPSASDWLSGSSSSRPSVTFTCGVATEGPEVCPGPGDCVRWSDGVVEGWTDGAGDGSDVGSLEGAGEGAGAGLVDGVGDGEADVDAEGSAVGIHVGDGVGSAVGLAVGVGVGCGVSGVLRTKTLVLAVSPVSTDEI